MSGKGLAGVVGGGRSAAHKRITAADKGIAAAHERVTRARVGAGGDRATARDGAGEAGHDGHAGLSGEAWLSGDDRAGRHIDGLARLSGLSGLSGGVSLGTGKRRLSVVRPLAGEWRHRGVLATRQVAAGKRGAGHGAVGGVAGAAAVAHAGRATTALGGILGAAEAGQLADESVGRLGIFLAAGASGLGHLGIGEDAVGDVDETPLVFTGHGVHVTMAQEALILEVLQFLDIAGVVAGFLDKELDGALVLLAAIDEGLFLIALRLHGNAGKLHIEGDGHHGGHEEDQEEGEAPLVVTAMFPREGVHLTRRRGESGVRASLGLAG